jgi:hypothetical protein
MGMNRLSSVRLKSSWEIEMSDDPIVEETRAVRAQIVHECGEDIHTFFEYLRQREKENQQEVVTLQPNAPESRMEGATSR